MKMNLMLFPYLNFNGQAAVAMKFYHSILGGDLKIQTFGDSGMPCAPEEKDLVVNAELKTDWFTFMASDGGKDHQIIMGDSVQMSLAGDQEAKLTEIFNKLAEGGSIGMPLAKQFWGDIYGQLTDKFGIRWMVDISSAKK